MYLFQDGCHIRKYKDGDKSVSLTAIGLNLNVVEGENQIMSLISHNTANSCSLRGSYMTQLYKSETKTQMLAGRNSDLDCELEINNNNEVTF